MDRGEVLTTASIAGQNHAPADILGRKQQVIPSPMAVGRPYLPVSTAEASLVPAATAERKRHRIASPTVTGHMLLPPATAEAGLAPAGIRPPKRQRIPLQVAHGRRMTPSTGGPIPVPAVTPQRNPGPMRIPTATDTATPVATSWQGFP